MELANGTAVDHPLRLLTCLATAICFPLNIAATIISLAHQRHRWARRHVTAFCFVFIPLAVTAATALLSLQYMKKHGKTPRALYFACLDLVAVFGYLAVLVPCWTVELGEFGDGGFGLLTGYVTAPMIVSMVIHIYFVAKTLPWKKVISSLNINTNSTCQQCPNCQAKFLSGAAPPVSKKGYSLLRGEEYLDVEADPIQYRDSEDFLGEGSERAEQPEQAAAAKDSGENKDIMV